MSDPKKEPKEQNNDSYDFFLNFMKKQKEQQTEKEMKKAKETKEPKNNSIKVTLIEFVVNATEAINHAIEDILMDNKKSKWFSLFLAVTLFAMVNGTSFMSVTEKTVNSVPVEVRNAPSDLGISGVVETVDLKLKGNIVNVQSSLYNSDYKVYIDLDNYSEGMYDVDLKVEGLPSGISYSTNPRKTTITLSKKESRVFALGYRFENENQKGAEYVLEPPTLAKSEVTVSAGKDTLDQIRLVEAVIDVSKVTSSFTQKAPIKAYDESGNELTVAIDPDSVDVSVGVTSSSKQVPVKINRTGKMMDGLALASLAANPSTVTIYGQKEVLDTIESVSASVDVSQIDTNKELYGVLLDVPEGVSSLSKDTVSVSATVDQRIYKPISDVSVSVLNNTNNYTLTYDQTVSLEASGALSHLVNIDSSAFSATINIKDLTPGEYDVKVTYRCNDTLIDLYPENEQIHIKIE